MRSVDIVVIGLGVHGSAAARELAARGWQVLGVEQSPDDQVWGASSGPVRMVREIDPHRPWLTALAVESVERWKSLSGSQTQQIFQTTPGLLVIAGEERREWSGTNKDWLQQVPRIPPGDPLLADLALEPGWEVVVDHRCGLLDARESVLALRDEARALGAELLFGNRVQLSDKRPAGNSSISIRIDQEDIAADRLLICAGAWSVGLPEWAQIPGLRVESSHMQLATFSGGSTSLDPGAFYVIYNGDERFCVIPRGPGNSLQFGHFSPPAGAALMSSTELAHATWQMDIAALRRYFPGLGQVQEHKTVQAEYTAPPDGAFILRWASPQVATLVACSGVGFKFAPSIASRVVAAFEGDDVPQDGFRVEKWT
jgi:cysteine desulfurase/selenocysteine lyase